MIFDEFNSDNSDQIFAFKYLGQGENRNWIANMFWLHIGITG